MTLLSVVIVNYRSGELLNACLEALFRDIDLKDIEVFVVNNDRAADLSSVQTLRKPGVQTIQNGENVGFGAAANIGFKQSKGEFLLLLNPDVVVRPGAVKLLLEAMQSRPEVGIALPQLRNPDDSLQYSCRRFYTWSALWMRRGPWRRRLASHPGRSTASDAGLGPCQPDRSGLGAGCGDACSQAGSARGPAFRRAILSVFRGC